MKSINFSNNFKKKLAIVAIILAVICSSGLYILYNLGLTDIPFIPKLPNEKQIKIACVGDSVTYGYGLYDWENNNYPYVLQQKLGSNYHVMNFGMSGHCVQDDSDRPYTTTESYEMSLKYEADIVVFMLGSNDSKVHNWQNEEHFRQAYCKLLDDYKDSNIILCTPATAYYIDDEGEVARENDSGITTFKIQPAIIEDIADIVRDVAKEGDYPLIEINDLTEVNPQWFTIDGTHPNDDGANAIAQAVYEKILELK